MCIFSGEIEDAKCWFVWENDFVDEIVGDRPRRHAHWVVVMRVGPSHGNGWRMKEWIQWNDLWSRRALWKTLTRYRAERSILLTTHVRSFLCWRLKGSRRYILIVPRWGGFLGWSHCSPCPSGKTRCLWYVCRAQVYYGRRIFYCCQNSRLVGIQKSFSRQFEHWLPLSHSHHCDVSRHESQVTGHISSQDQRHSHYCQCSSLSWKSQRAVQHPRIWCSWNNNWRYIFGSLGSSYQLVRGPIIPIIWLLVLCRIAARRCNLNRYK